MPGFVYVTSSCLVCRAPFGYNPNKVPSHPAHNEGGRLVPSMNIEDPKAPICSNCINVINQERERLGQPLWPVEEGAYEATEEENVF